MRGTRPAPRGAAERTRSWCTVKLPTCPSCSSPAGPGAWTRLGTSSAALCTQLGAAPATHRSSLYAGTSALAQGTDRWSAGHDGRRRTRPARSHALEWAAAWNSGKVPLLRSQALERHRGASRRACRGEAIPQAAGCASPRAPARSPSERHLACERLVRQEDGTTAYKIWPADASLSLDHILSVLRISSAHPLPSFLLPP
jgi:hypothetical protein